MNILLIVSALRVAVVGDAGNTTRYALTVAPAILALRPLPDIYLSLGDWTAHGAPQEWPNVNSVNSIFAHLGVPIISSSGNHDLENRKAYQQNVWVEPHRSYYIGTDVAFHCMDYTQPIADRVAWATETLIRDSIAGVRVILFASHGPPVTTAQGSADDSLFRIYIVPILERFNAAYGNVVAGFFGHIHGYEHSKLPYVKSSGDTAYLHIYTVGTAGSTLYSNTQWLPAQSWTVYRESRFFGYLLVDIAGDTLQTTFVRADGGNQLDKTTLVGNSR
jgi:hypothetical protein